METEKERHFKRETTEELNIMYKVFLASENSMMANAINEELEKRVGVEAELKKINHFSENLKFPIIKTVENFYSDLIKHKNHRYMSWEHCFNAFQKPEHSTDKDYLSLQLAFYLASWGMYRGSSALLWKDYKIHYETVNIIQGYDTIRCCSDKEIDKNQIEKIITAKDDIAKHYREVEYIKPTNEGEKKGFITATDTLITKILLGTLGCVPAYDRLLLIGLKEEKIEKSFNKKSLNSLFDFINNNIADLKAVQEKINQKEGCYYPIMKIVDMYFWEVGRIKSPQLAEIGDN